MGKIKTNIEKWRAPLMIGTATEGWIRYEWANARFSPIIPINWMAHGFDVNFAALGYDIDSAYNLMVRQAIQMDVDWLLIIEDDVLIPPDLFIRINQYVKTKEAPVVSGLYFSKGNPSEPLVFRGRGNGCFYKWKMGDRVWADGVPMGCVLFHMDLLKYLWERSPEYRLVSGEVTRRIFHTPRKVDFKFHPFHFQAEAGTQDLYFCDRLLEDKNKAIRESGWPKIARRKYPLLVDTNIYCKHIDRKTGRMYPLEGGPSANFGT